MNSSLPSKDLTGQTLRDYKLLRRLGRGGMADVYLAKQLSLERNVALKILRPELATDESYVKRFHREAQSAAALVQANIVQIFEVGEVAGLHFIAQEYVHGRNLRQYLDRYGAVEPVMAMNVLRQCALALQKAAELNVVHRDIKPENIMLSTNGDVKVTDFGLARINNDPSKKSLTQIGITMGTPLYMSPEQVEGRALDSRSDIYSLGVTAYHTLAGQPPFDGENPLSIALRQVQEQATPLASVRPDVPVELCQIIHRMMAKDAAERPGSPTVLLKELRQIKIDIEDDWDDVVSKLALTESNHFAEAETLSQSRLAATQALQTIMHGHVRSWWKNGAVIGTLVALSMISLMLGVLAAQRTIPVFPLEIDVAADDRIPKEETIEKQYEAAYWGTLALGSSNDQKKIEFWQAVSDYFPMDMATTETINQTEYYQLLTQTRLGEVYLSQRKFPEALGIYHHLEEGPDKFERFRVIGTAGKAIVYDRSKQDSFPGGVTEQQKKVRECLSKIGGKADLLNTFMRNEIEDLRNRYSASPAYSRGPWARLNRIKGQPMAETENVWGANS